MNTLTWVVFLAVVFPAVILLFVPSLTPRRYYFGLTVASGFPDSPAGRQIRRSYSLAVVCTLLVSVGLIIAWEKTLLVAMLLPPLVGGLAFFQARSRVARTSAVPGSPSPAIREADVSRGPEALPRWTLLGVPPFAILLGVALYLHRHWSQLPERFPVHWGGNGQPNRWVERTAHGVYGPLWFGAGILLLLIFIGVTTFYGARRSPLRLGMLKILIATMYLIGFVFGWVGLLPLQRFSRLALLVPAPLFVIAILAYTFKLSSDLSIPVDTTPDSCWRLSELYYNPADPALFVQKRVGIGYTLNFGNHLSWVILGITFAAIGGLVFLLR